MEKIKSNWKTILRRLLFSAPSAIIVLFLAILLRFAVWDNGTKMTLWEDIYICLLAYVMFLIPFNIIIRFIQSKSLGMKFIDFLTFPQKGLIVRIRESREILSLLHPDKSIIIPKTYNQAITELKNELQKKAYLARIYTDHANTSLTESDFYDSIGDCISTLKWMQQFEKYGVFTVGSCPSDDIQAINDGMPASLNRLHERMAHDSAKKEVEVNIDNMDGHSFEYYCAGLLEKNGFQNVEVTRGSGDHGIDILAEKDGITYAIQCKCYSSNIGNAAIQQAHSGRDIYEKDIAVVLTNRYFTNQAKADAAKTGVKLWDRDVLLDMIYKSKQ